MIANPARDHQLSAPAGVFGNIPSFGVSLPLIYSKLGASPCSQGSPSPALLCPAFQPSQLPQQSPTRAHSPSNTSITDKGLAGAPIHINPSACTPPIPFLLLMEQCKPSRPNIDHQESKQQRTQSARKDAGKEAPL